MRLALLNSLNETVPVRFVSLPTLIDMKRKVGRPEDLADIEQLKKLTDGVPRE
jgi:hypothetical protein